jgi:DNA-binding transcriptional LysR family regulator
MIVCRGRPGVVAQGGGDAGGAGPLAIHLVVLGHGVTESASRSAFTHAAERMYIAQPTLSQQIRRLEEMVGTPLLRRLREGVRLTEAGISWADL